MPPKEKNSQGNDLPVIIPTAVINRLEQELQDIDFGGVSLVVTVRDGHPTFRIEKTVSIMAGV
jgi:hypothetical protein